MKVLVECDRCDIEINLEEDGYSFCDKCNEEQLDEFDQSEILDAIKSSLSLEYLWNDKDVCTGFNNDGEKDIYLSGVKHGMEVGLFWLCDYFGNGMVEQFEKLIKKEQVE